MDKQEIIKILKANKNLIENNNFEELYDNLKWDLDSWKEISLFTELFLKSGVDPLKYISYIPEYYAYQSNLTYVDIPDNITNIGENAFEECKELIQVNFKKGSKIVEINDSSFCDCSKLKNIKLNTIEAIYISAFNGCKSLENIYLSINLRYIGDYAFYECDNLKNIYYEGSEEDWENIEIEEDGNKSLFKAKIHYNSKI